jgi:hypothetical protein
MVRSRPGSALPYPVGDTVSIMQNEHKAWIRHAVSGLVGLIAGGLAVGVLGVALGVLVDWVRGYEYGSWWPVLFPMFGAPVGALVGMVIGISRSARHKNRKAA